MDGIFLINKPVGWTSFDICAKLRKKFDTKKVGHSGTLDPFAEGLMVVALGKATKILPFLEDVDKTYVAKLSLGEATDTLDKTGKIIDTKEVPSLSNDEIVFALNKFLGHSKQVPPMYSALKKDGIPLYQLAREGIEIERKERDIYISNIKLISFENNIIEFEAKVSKGTYIRSLAYDIAIALNTTGHLISLIRTQVGDDKLCEAYDINDVEPKNVRSMKNSLSHIKTIKVDETIKNKIMNGIRLYFACDDSIILLIDIDDNPLAIYEKRDDGFYYTKRGLF